MARILIVEDSPTMRQLISFALQRIEGAEISEAADGAEAIAVLGRESFDLVLADINMPVMDGLKLVQHIRSTPACADLPVIIITTEGAEADRRRALDLGATAYLTKPIQTHQLVDLVRSLLG